MDSGLARTNNKISDDVYLDLNLYGIDLKDADITKIKKSQKNYGDDERHIYFLEKLNGQVKTVPLSIGQNQEHNFGDIWDDEKRIIDGGLYQRSLNITITSPNIPVKIRSQKNLLNRLIGNSKLVDTISNNYLSVIYSSEHFDLDNNALSFDCIAFPRFLISKYFYFHGTTLTNFFTRSGVSPTDYFDTEESNIFELKLKSQKKLPKRVLLPSHQPRKHLSYRKYNNKELTYILRCISDNRFLTEQSHMRDNFTRFLKKKGSAYICGLFPQGNPNEDGEIASLDLRINYIPMKFELTDKKDRTVNMAFVTNIISCKDEFNFDAFFKFARETNKTDNKGKAKSQINGIRREVKGDALYDNSTGGNNQPIDQTSSSVNEEYKKLPGAITNLELIDSSGDSSILSQYAFKSTNPTGGSNDIAEINLEEAVLQDQIKKREGLDFSQWCEILNKVISNTKLKDITINLKDHPVDHSIDYYIWEIFEHKKNRYSYLMEINPDGSKLKQRSLLFRLKNGTKIRIQNEIVDFDPHILKKLNEQKLDNRLWRETKIKGTFSSDDFVGQRKNRGHLDIKKIITLHLTYVDEHVTDNEKYQNIVYKEEEEIKLEIDNFINKIANSAKNSKFWMSLPDSI